MSGPTSILPKMPQTPGVNQQSLIRVTLTSTASLVQVQQRVQILIELDGKLQSVKSATMTLTPATAAQATKNAIVVTNTGQTAQVISSSSQVISGSPIMVTNANLVQQLTSGKPVNCNRQPSCNT
ncbi:uncharacterized protein [Temnothorax nylanderi]|uniref:uncharacterized protein isoform X2 n=1 Tax=Temnothorax nylanderi TaxID=102681 RepID=UPI003A864F10